MSADQFSYLEDAQDKTMKRWVQSENERTLAMLRGDPRFSQYKQIATNDERVPDDLGPIDGRSLVLDRNWAYQLLLDENHPRGIWRRTTLATFLSQTPQWQSLLDIDAISRDEGKNWTFLRAFFSPSGRHCLVALSDGGSITTEWREFDVERAAFVDDGFVVPASFGSHVVWRNDQTLIVNADFGPGTTNKAKRPIAVREWRRGQRLSEAKEIFRAEPDDIAVSVNEYEIGTGELGEHESWMIRIVQIDDQKKQKFWQIDRSGSLQRMTMPDRTSPKMYGDHYLFVPHSDWQIGGKTWKAGSLLSIPINEVTRLTPTVTLVVEPGADSAIMDWVATKDYLLIFDSFLAKGRVWKARFSNGTWKRSLVPLPERGTILWGMSDVRSDAAFVVYQDFIQPLTLYKLGEEGVTVVKQARASFDGAKYVIEQFEAPSSGGVSVPYFVVRSRDMHFDGKAPTLVDGYGASGGSSIPMYNRVVGTLWLEQGGVYVLANVRGGQERGRKWWVTGTARQGTYDDMIAVLEDLVRRGITSPKRMGITGHSAGGLLVGSVMTQKPDLLGAVVIQAGVLDNFRMDLTSIGVKFWEAEFGSPSIPEERSFLDRTSPFQNIKPSSSLPTPFIITSTTDQTVNPAHSRRLAAKMQSMRKPFFFLETSEGGHGLAFTPAQRAELNALIYTYLARQLMRL